MNRNIAIILSARDAGLRTQLAASAAAITAFDNRVSRAGGGLAKFGAVAKTVGAAMAVALAIGLGYAIKQAVAFEVQMQNVATVMRDLPVSQIERMSDAVVEMSTQLPQSAETLAKGLYEIGSSGFYGADALRILEVSATAASAGLTDTDTAAKAVLQVLNAYGMEASEAADVSDVLFSTVEFGVLTFHDLATQLGDTLGSAAAAGIAFDEVGAAIATMTLAGLNAAESTVSLNRLIQKLIKPSAELNDALHNLGYESGEAALATDGLHGVMEKLRIATGGSITELVKIFPEIRAARAAFALMSAEGQNYARVFERITDETQRAGSTQEAFNIQMQALGNQWTVFRNKLNAVAIEVGTALIPMLKSGLEGLEQVGARAGAVLRSAAAAAAPAFDALARAGAAAGQALGAFWKEASPIIRGFATLTFGAAVAAFTALGNAAEAALGPLSEHPGVLRAIAIALGGLLLAKGVGLALNSMVAVRLGVWAINAATALGGLAGALRAIGSALLTFATGSIGTQLAMMSKGFAALKTGIMNAGAALLSSPFVAGTAVVAALYTFQQAFDTAGRKADEFIQKVNQKVDLSTLDGLKEKSQLLREEMTRLDEEWEGMGGGGFMTVLKGTAELLTPLENKVLDNAVAWKKLNKEQQNVKGDMAVLEHTLATLSNRTGIAADTIEVLLNNIEGFDITDPMNSMQDMEEAVRGAYVAMRDGTPATEAMSAAIEQAGDVTVTATDRVEAFSGAIDALIGTMLGAFDAETAFGAAIQDLATTLAETEATLDPFTEAGVKNREAFSGAASAAIDWAKQTAEATGNIPEAVAGLRDFTGRLRETMIQGGFTAEQVDTLLQSMGLYEGNYEAVLGLSGAEESNQALFDIQGMLMAVDKARAVGHVDLDSAPFENNAIAVGTWLAEIGKANPKATVSMDGKPFMATAEQVQTWADTWSNSSWQAEALLNIIDPENKFNTLDEAAAAWEKTEAEAEAKVDASQANNMFESVEQRGSHWSKRRDVSRVQSDGGQAHGVFASTERRGSNWGRRRDNSTVGAIDKATPTINSIERSLTNVARTYNARIQVSGVVLPSAQAALNIINNKLLQRRGGAYEDGSPVVHAATGYAWQAGVVRQPTMIFGERETGGEAFIPRYGNINRSKAILARAASWYGMEVRPAGTVGVGLTQTFAPNINVNVRADAGIDTGRLTRAIGDVIDERVNDGFRRFQRAVGAN